MKQQKKTSAASTSMSTVKKNVIRSPIKSRSTVTPLGGSIQSLETAVTDIVISYVTKGDGREAAYIKPLIDAWRSEDHDKCTESWYIDSVVPRRDGDTNEPMTASSTLPYPWECIVTLRGSYQETPTEIGHKLAASFSGFTTPISARGISNSNVMHPLLHRRVSISTFWTVIALHTSRKSTLV